MPYVAIECRRAEENNIEKCHKIAQLMLEKEGSCQNLSDFSTLNQPKEAQNGIFDVTENDSFSSVSHTKRQLSRARGPSYRRIKTYYKSTNQYWKERNRRKQAWELSGKGFTYKQIAEKLGVSVRTVIRDINKIRPYLLRQAKAYFRKLGAQHRRELQQRLEGATLHQRLDILMAEWEKVKRIMDYEHNYLRHQMFVNIDFDDMTDGYPAIKFWPKNTINSYTMPITVNFCYIKDGKKEHIGAFKLSYKRRW